MRKRDNVGKLLNFYFNNLRTSSIKKKAIKGFKENKESRSNLSFLIVCDVAYFFFEISRFWDLFVFFVVKIDARLIKMFIYEFLLEFDLKQRLQSVEKE